MNTEIEITTYDIPEYNIERLNKEVATLNRRAVKIGVAPIEVVIHSKQFVPCPHAVSNASMSLTAKEIAKLPQIEQYTISIDGEGPKVEGYKFVGTLDHNSIPGQVLVNTVPGESVPSDFFEAKAICHHCDKIRRRTETFIFEKDDGTYMQVGRSCLRDFFGHDPSHIARFLSRVITFVGSLGDGEGYGGGGRGEYHFPQLAILANTIAMIRSEGWVPRSSADFSSKATADNVSFIMLPAYGPQQAEKERFVASINFKPESDTIEAQKALIWLGEQDATSSSYTHNLKALSTMKMIPVSKFGYWCSLASAYQRAQDRLEIKRQESLNRVNEHVGEIKERIELDVECTGISYTAGQYGTVCIHRMLTTDGKTLVWFANTGAKMDKGDKYTIKGTVKKHDVYNDWKQTQLTRVKVIQEKSEEAVVAT